MGRAGITYPELCHVKCNILVKRVQNHLRDALITPSTMHQEQLSQIAKLPNSNVGAACCLQALHTTDANSNVGSLNHGDVVGTVTNSKQKSFQVSFDELDN